MMDYSEEINKISEMLFGYREASVDEITFEIKRLVEVKKQHNQQAEVTSLFNAIRELAEHAKEIEEG